MPRTRLALALVVLGTVLVLAAPLRLVWDWYRVAQIAPDALPPQPGRSFDGVHWEDRGGQVVAAYVVPRGPAAAAGIAEGDTFLAVEGAMLFDAETVSSTIGTLPQGREVRVEVRHGGQPHTRTLALTRYPTFLYPRSAALGAFALWGFVVAAFLHGVGLALAAPLASASREGRYVQRLILVSGLWIGTTLVRLLLLEVVGPPRRAGGLYDLATQALSVAGVVGWILFPALLVGNVLHRTRLARHPFAARLQALRWLPALLLVALALVTTLRGGLGPIGLDTLVPPILLHATGFVALAAALPLVLAPARSGARLPGGFSRVGSGLTLLAAGGLTAALLGVGPLAALGAEARAWVVVAAQLLAVAPVMLVAHATLRFGKMDAVVTRAVTAFVAAGAFFFAFAAVLALVRPLVAARQPSWPLVAGLVAVTLFALFHALLVRLWEAPPRWLTTERQRARARIAQFQEEVPLVLDAAALADRALRLACEATGARSGVLFYPHDDGWKTAHYHPEPPYLTASMAARVWPHLRESPRVWARRVELREQVLPPEHARLLESVGADVALPLVGEAAPLGMLLLSGKHDRRAVFNLDDLDLLRLVASAFALGLERLARIEREKLLARQSTEAQLVALRAQINPHFLFNALNTIAALIAERPGEAEDAVEHLAKIFRHTLTTAAAPTVPLGAELDLVGRYLAIETMRFGDRLRLTIDVPADLHGRPVPAFALQTLVENAVKHGLEPKRGPVDLAVRARLDAHGALVLSVQDSGVGVKHLPAAELNGDGAAPSATVDPATYGIGLSNVAARLADLYARPDLLRLESAPGAGTTATITLPETP